MAGKGIGGRKRGGMTRRSRDPQGGAPEKPTLADMQAWLGRAISRPLPREFQGNPLAVSAPELRAEADSLVRGWAGLAGFDRVGIYNQQYWFRLVSIMQGEYPCALRLIGLEAYNAWAVRYLEAHPPSSPYLSRLDGEWPAFMDAHYREADRSAVLQAIAFDRAFSKAFDAPAGLSLSTASGAGAAPDPGGLMALPLQLAPHVTILRLDWDFAAYRARCLADEGLELSFELKPGASRMAVWRDGNLELWQKPVSPAAWKVLRELEKPATVSEVFARLEGAFTREEQADLEANLGAWFQEWTRAPWLVKGDSAP